MNLVEMKSFFENEKSRLGEVERSLQGKIAGLIEQVSILIFLFSLVLVISKTETVRFRIQK